MLSKSGIHAVRALIFLAEQSKDTYVGAATIAERIGAPRNYLGKLLQQLSRDGLLESQKGLGGGFRLAKDPAEIMLFHVVEPIDQINRWSGCILGRATCSEVNPCAIHNRWKEVKDGYLHLLTSTSIAELAAQQEGNEP